MVTGERDLQQYCDGQLPVVYRHPAGLCAPLSQRNPEGLRHLLGAGWRLLLALAANPRTLLAPVAALGLEPPGLAPGLEKVRCMGVELAQSLLLFFIL